jgi:hypothetical protein
MIVPSNDAFVANDNPAAFRVFSDTGAFLGPNILVMGSMVMDAGSEVNDEVPMNTAFLAQMAPNTGVTEGGVVMIHLGFLPPGVGNILSDPVLPMPISNSRVTRLHESASRLCPSRVP